jgi:YidC/Oxa1 family membrane protein insertase
MEKRGLLAMGLILLMLLLYQIFFITPKAPQQQAPSAGQTAEQAPGGQAAAEVSRPPATESPGAAFSQAAVDSQQAPERITVVETPLYVARFSSHGGVLNSLRLAKFPGTDDKPVELVAEGARLPLEVVLLTTSGERIDLSATAFVASVESLAVSGRAELSLEYSLTTAAGLKVSKTIGFSGDTYAMRATLEVSGPGAETIRAVEIGWQSGLGTTEANRSDDLRNFAAITLTEEGLVKNSLGKVHKNQQAAVGGPVVWSGVRSKYFLASFVPLGAGPVVARTFEGNGESIGMVLEAERAEGKPLEFLVYAGPLDYQGLKAMGHRLEKAVDFGWKWLSPLSKGIFLFLVYCYKAIPNYGWVIIVLSGLLKLLFQPLTSKSMRSMRDMQRLQPEMQALRDKYKKEPQKLNAAMMELYRKRGINPVGGCLPLLLQMPVFFALFNVLSKTIELRRAGFVWWIKDLSTPDVIAHLPFSLPFIGTAVSLLPILMGIAMFFQQKMTPTDPKQAMMTYLLPIVFTFMFFRFPSGLVLYWLVNNVLTIIHQYLMNRADRIRAAQTATT